MLGRKFYLPNLEKCYKLIQHLKMNHIEIDCNRSMKKIKYDKIISDITFIQFIEKESVDWCDLGCNSKSFNFKFPVDIKHGPIDGPFTYLYNKVGLITFEKNFNKTWYRNKQTIVDSYVDSWKKIAEEDEIVDFHLICDVKYGPEEGPFIEKHNVSNSIIFDDAFFGCKLIGKTKFGYYKCGLKEITDSTYDWRLEGDTGDSFESKVKLDLKYGPVEGPFQYIYGHKGYIQFDDGFFLLEKNSDKKKKFGWSRTPQKIIDTCTTDWKVIGVKGDVIDALCAVDLKYGPNNGPFTYKYNVTGTIKIDDETFPTNYDDNNKLYCKCCLE